MAKDPARAVELYCEAARQGDAEAQFSLGWMYANGRGMPRDNRMASLFFAMAAAQGHEYAQKMLGFVGPSAAELPECMRDPPPPPVEETVEAADVEEPFVASTPGQKQAAELVLKLAPEYRISPLLALAIIRAESNFDPNAVSAKNAQGLMQLIPETSARFNVRKPFDPAQNVRGGLAYLRWLLAYFRGDVALVAAAYNAGEGTVDRYRGIPPFAETRAYVQRIKRWFRKESHPYDATVADPSPELAPHPRRERALDAAMRPLRSLDMSPALRVAGALLLLVVGMPRALAGLPEAVERVKPSIVGVGTFQKLRSPSYVFSGTGFVVEDGTLVATAGHVVPESLQTEARETMMVWVRMPGASEPQAREATVVAVDREHDLALLRISGAALPAVTLGNMKTVRDGQSIGFTGFPFGHVLGFVPVTHRGIIASSTPISVPGPTSKQLDAQAVRDSEVRSVRPVPAGRDRLPWPKRKPAVRCRDRRGDRRREHGPAEGQKGRGAEHAVGHQFRGAGAVPAGADPLVALSRGWSAPRRATRMAAGHRRRRRRRRVAAPTARRVTRRETAGRPSGRAAIPGPTPPSRARPRRPRQPMSASSSPFLTFCSTRTIDRPS